MAANLPPARLFSKKTQAFIYNPKPPPVQAMLDFDYIAKRETPSIAGLISPGAQEGNHKTFFGVSEIMIPIYGSTELAAKSHPEADVFISYASYRSAAASALIALQMPTIRTVVIVAEGVPISDVRRLIATAKKLGKILIGPATVGGIQAGAFKIGDTAGTVENILHCKLYRPGSVGFVSKSGGLSNEMYNILSKTTNGLYEGIAIGGDVFPGSTFADHVLRFQDIDEIKMIVILGELGGDNEYGVVDALKSGKITKPVVAWVSGTCATMFPTEVQFGHAGAKSGGGDKESARGKITALREAGAIVPTSFEGFAQVIQETYQKLVKEGVIVEKEEEPPREMPNDFMRAHKSGLVRRATGIVSSICDDRGEEPTYAGVSMSELIEGNGGIGEVIGLLWFKRKLPQYACKFIEMCLILVADHGPCVSGAHNTIVASRAGKDLVSCVCSGMLTIGPRFGGAIDDAARYFKYAVDNKLEPDDFVEDMKKKGMRVPGIGHRIKSANNRDKRVMLLQDYARKHFPSTRFLDYAVRVEEYTLQKASNLVLNVDGCIAALFLDLMDSSSSFNAEEMESIVNIGYLNGLFILGRTIGLVGHALDQKRLNQPLYRHPWDDVMYC